MNWFGSVTVFGAGALGSLVGAYLSRVVPVTLVGRRAHVNAVNARGLAVTGLGERTFPEPLRFARAAEACPPLEGGTLCIVTVKAFDAAAAAKAIVAAGGERRDCAAVFLQNGMGFERDVESALGGAVTQVGAVSHLGATFVEPGKVEDWGGEIVCDGSELGRALADLLASCGVAARASDDLERERWKKIALNCALNPVAALFGFRNRETLLPELLPVRETALHECAEVATASGVPLSGKGLLREFEERVAKSNNVNSMLQDIRARRRTEIDYLNGFFADRGPELNIPCPVNAALAAFIRVLSMKGGAP